MPVLTVRVSDTEHSSLVHRARDEGVSLSALVRQALRLRDQAEDLSEVVGDHEKRIGRLESMAGLA